MKKLFLFTIALLLSVSLFSQTSDKYRRYLTRNGDTLEVKSTKVLKTSSFFMPTDSTSNLSDYALLKHPSINAQTGTTYTLVLTDDAKLLTLNNASAISLTVPANSSVAFPIGTQITLIQLGSGQVTVVAGGGVSVYSSGGALKLTGQYSSATLIKIASDTWLLIGDITV